MSNMQYENLIVNNKTRRQIPTSIELKTKNKKNDMEPLLCKLSDLVLVPVSIGHEMGAGRRDEPDFILFL